MSSHQPFSPQIPVVGEVEHVNHLSDQLGKLYLSDEFSDVLLVLGDNQTIPAHKVILAARSEYFRALLFGGMRESSQHEVKLVDTPFVAFKHLLKYIYTGNISLHSYKEDMILEVLSLAHLYGFLELETSISEYLKAVLCVKSVCLIYDTASLYQLSDLARSALQFMDRHAGEVLQHEAFQSLSESAVKSIISRDSFCAAEVDIFKAVDNWSRANPSLDIGNILAEIRLELVTIPDLLKVVRPTELIPADVLLDAIQSRTEMRDTDLRYRGYKMPGENVAVPRHGANVLVGEVKSALLDGDSKNYDMERGFSRHAIDDGDRGIVVKLGMPCIINRINMLLWDRDNRAYSYYIDVSMDQSDWVRVVDHSTFHCRSWQYLYFPQRVVKFIRIVGTHNTVNKVFHVVTLEAMWSEEQQSLHNGLIIPRENIATLAKSALVIEGVCRTRNALLNGDTQNYDWDSGYTCHQLGSGAIVVQLGQPYSLDNMRLLLWDCDDRSYSYYIEVSVNQKEWEVVCDRTRDPCQSWQLITFPRRPVVFIRIVGTHNTANEVFHCVHFEAPGSGNSERKSVVSSRNNEDNMELENYNVPAPDNDAIANNLPDADGIHVEQQQMQQMMQGINVNDPLQVPLGLGLAQGGPPLLPLNPVAGAQPQLQGIDIAANALPVPQQYNNNPMMQVQQLQNLGAALPRAMRQRRDSNSSSSNT